MLFLLTLTQPTDSPGLRSLLTHAVRVTEHLLPPSHRMHAGCCDLKILLVLVQNIAPLSDESIVPKLFGGMVTNDDVL